HLGARPFAEQHNVAGPDVEWDELAPVVATTGPTAMTLPCCGFFPHRANQVGSNFREAQPGFELANGRATTCCCRGDEQRAVPKRAGGESPKLRMTWAVQTDGVHPPGVLASGSDLRAEPFSGRASALVGALPLSRASCARRVFHRPCAASSRE